MGTAGPLGLARHILEDGSGDPFFVLNRSVMMGYHCMVPQATITEAHVLQCPMTCIIMTTYMTCLVPCSDVICEFPLREMLAFHKEKGAEATLLVTKVHMAHP